jgi:L-fucose mutarotase
MLRGLSQSLSPDLPHVLASMGHGERTVLPDTNFPAATHARHFVRLPGVTSPQMQETALSVLPLEDVVQHAAFTIQVKGIAAAVPEAVQDFTSVLQCAGHIAAAPRERFAFYEHGAAAFGVVATDETRIYGNTLLEKSVVRP